MTEDDYLSLRRPFGVANLMRGRKTPLRSSARKVRLFACACCRRVWDVLPEHSRQAVEAAERAADKVLRAWSLWPLYKACDDAVRRVLDRGRIAYDPARFAAWPMPWVHSENACSDAACLLAWSSAVPENHRTAVVEAEYRAQCDVLHDLLGNPFRRPPAAPRPWRPAPAGTAVRLAGSIYDTRAFGDLPVLADALEDEGCADAELLAHLREPGQHVRGCWALDLVLGKN
jgi:hypothetical protein